MTRSSLLTLAAAAALTPAWSPASAAVPSATALATRVLHDPGTAASPRRTGHAPKSPPIARVADANRGALREPDAAYYLGAAQVYPWSDGSLYRLYAAPEQITDIALQPGEGLVSVAAGDTARWIIGDTASGSGSGRRTHILVKPASSGLRTNLVIATDRRIYHVEAISTPRTAMTSISWIYPQDSLIAVRAAAGAESVAAPAVAVDALSFDYRIEGNNVAWRPVRVFDDGHQTFIEFPANFNDGEAPPLFVVGADGKAQLVNYRVKGRYYVVDSLFAVAELRFGGKHQQIVRIVRDNGRRGSGRRA